MLLKTFARSWVQLILVGTLILLAFAAPTFVTATHSTITEMSLGRLIVSTFGGLTLSVFGAVSAALLWNKNSPLRARADALVSFGLSTKTAALPIFLTAVVLCALWAAVLGASFVSLLRGTSTLSQKNIWMHDAIGTAWSVGLGTTFWFCFAIALMARSGKSKFAYVVIAIDLVSRLLLGPAAWLSPSNHIANVLGAPPPTSLIRVPILSQSVSVGTLITLSVGLFFLALVRYQGRPKE